MTPFGAALRRMRAERGITQRAMADAIGVSPAYLSALEHGHRGRPSWEFVQKAIGFFNIIWDEAEELQRLAYLSDPKIKLQTSGLSEKKTEIANRLAHLLPQMTEKELATLAVLLDQMER